MKLFKKICRKIYLTGKDYDLELKSQAIENYAAIIGKDTCIEDEALIQNTNRDKTKIRIGDNCHIRGHLLTMKHGGKIEIGNHCFIGPQTKVWSSISIKMGNRVLVSHNVNIHDNTSHPLNSTERHEDFKHIRNIGFQEQVNIREKEIVIEDDVWIGFNATILKGVTIGYGAIVGANTIITKDVPPYAVVVGNPARIIKYTT